MTTGTVKACVVATVVAVAGTIGVAQTADPAIGTWKLNVAKSTYSPGPAPKSGTVVFSAAGTGLKLVVSGVAGTGEKMDWGYNATYDGKDYPITGNNPDADTINGKVVDARTVVTVNKKAGKVTTTNRRVVSADGKTMTVTTTGTNGAGAKVNNVQVFEKG